MSTDCTANIPDIYTDSVLMSVPSDHSSAHSLRRIELRRVLALSVRRNPNVGAAMTAPTLAMTSVTLDKWAELGSAIRRDLRLWLV
jgi:hypothetical protein